MSTNGLEFSKYLRVIGTYGWGEKAGLVVNESKVSKEERKSMESRKGILSGNVSKIVGFEIYNCAAEKENTLVPVVFEIPVRHWVQDGPDSKYYVELQETLILNPGDKAIIEACDFIAYVLNNSEVYGRTLENGVIKQSNRGGKEMRKLNKLKRFTPEVAAFFCFSFSPDCVPKLRVHDPEVKKSVGVKRNGVWKVKDEYKLYFGFLEMGNVTSRKVRKLVQEQVANKIRTNYAAYNIEK